MKEKIMFSSLWMQVLLCLSVATMESHDESHPLCFYLKTPIIKQINVTVGSLLDGNTTERCSKPTDSCYILWQEDPKNKSITIISQGCWNDANQKCQQNECIPSRSTKALDNTHFCCCEGNFCNTNITDVKNTSECCVDDPTQHFLGNISYTMHVVIITVSVILLLALVTMVYFLHRYCCTMPKRSNESLHLMEAPPPAFQNFDLDTLKLQESLARGRYGSVYRGNLNDQSVAVKKFAYQNQQHFLNERAIYLLPHMDHPCLPKYIGFKEQISEDGRPEFLLVVSFSPLGCLQDYLRENTFDWNNMCKMILSVARGLAHLHSEIRKGDKFKPSIVHRDVTSRNILVKMDGTCMLCDFGFATQISGPTYVLNGAEVKAEETSLADVGTLRYMAPEILEGAVNLRDCESSLKQTDVYALGLVIWESASRCVELYKGMEVPPYKLPYEAEIGHDPTMEQMQTLVVKHKSRPLFPDIWRATNPAIRSLKETIEDCWDQDAEARLTALCVEERISDLPVLWERDKAGLNVSSGISPALNPVSNLQKSSSYHNKSSDSDFGSESLDDQLISTRERANSLSECTTETLLSPSDTVCQTNDKNKLLGNTCPPMKVTYPVQPHQGRNPCMARNLMQERSADYPVIGDRLVDCSSKYPKMISFSDGDANIFSLPPGMESNLMPNSNGIHSNRIINPITFVQNEVGSIPKDTNITRQFLLKTERRWNPLSIFDKKTGIRASLRMLLDRKTSVSSGNIPEEQQPLKSSGISSPTSPGQTNPVNAYWTTTEKEEENFCPSNLPNIDDGNAVMKSYDHHLLNGHAISVSDGNCLPSVHKFKRPTTLPVNILNDAEVDNDNENTAAKELPVDTSVPIQRRGSGNRKKGVKRVKTPFEMKCHRFSLYDDRIMSQELPTDHVSGASPPQLDTSKFSASVPLNMNTLCQLPTKDSNKTDSETQVKVVSTAAQPNVFSLCDI